MPPQPRIYDDLRLRVERVEDGCYRVFAAAPCGEASGTFAPPFGDLEIENFVLRASRSGTTRRRMQSPETEYAQRFGAALFDALFHGRVRDVYHEALADADRSERGLRLSFALTDVPELIDLPWEFLYDEPNFLSISVLTPIVRYLDLPRARRPLVVEPPLRILGMVSNPAETVALDVEREKADLEDALGGLIDRGVVELRWLEAPTLGELLQVLRTDTFHVFHYIGHGQYDPSVEDGVLLLEDGEGRGRPVSGTQLGTILRDHTSLRLAVLNACEGARTGRDDPFAGVAASLVQRELPAVIAMQFAISDDAAIVFAKGFYEGIAASLPVDAALAEARKAIFADHNDIEWGTPVLFMRVADGRVFDVPAESARSIAPAVSVTLAAEPPVIASGQTVRWRLGVENLAACPLRSVTAQGADGGRLAGPFDLATAERQEVEWTSTAERDMDLTVTVGAKTPGGTLVSGQATAHAAVRAPEPAPTPAAAIRSAATPEAPPPEPARRPVHHARRWRVGPTVWFGALLAAAGAVVLRGALQLDWLQGLSNFNENAIPGKAQHLSDRAVTVLVILAAAALVSLAVRASRRDSPVAVLAWVAAGFAAFAYGAPLTNYVINPPGLAGLGWRPGRYVGAVGAGIIALGGAIVLIAALTSVARAYRHQERSTLSGPTTT